MEMSQRIHFWYQISQKMSIFLLNGKKTHFLVKKFLDWLQKEIWVKNTEIALKSC